MNQSCVRLDGLKIWAPELDRSMHWKAKKAIFWSNLRLSFARKTQTSSPDTTSIISIYRGFEIGQMNSVKEAAGVARQHYLAGAESSNLSKNSSELEPVCYLVGKATEPGI